MVQYCNTFFYFFGAIFKRFIGKFPNIGKQCYILLFSALITWKVVVISSFFTKCNMKFTFYGTEYEVKVKVQTLLQKILHNIKYLWEMFL